MPVSGAEVEIFAAAPVTTENEVDTAGTMPGGKLAKNTSWYPERARVTVKLENAATAVVRLVTGTLRVEPSTSYSPLMVLLPGIWPVLASESTPARMQETRSG